MTKTTARKKAEYLASKAVIKLDSENTVTFPPQYVDAVLEVMEPHIWNEAIEAAASWHESRAFLCAIEAGLDEHQNRKFSKPALRHRWFAGNMRALKKPIGE